MEPLMIYLSQCKPGILYRLRGRKLMAGVWTGKEFIGTHDYKGQPYLNGEYHRETDRAYGMTSPIEVLAECPIALADVNIHNKDLYLWLAEEERKAGLRK